MSATFRFRVRASCSGRGLTLQTGVPIIPDVVPEYLFAYGTLRPGLAPPAIRPAVDQLVAVGPGTTPGKLFDLGEYPGAIFGTGDTVHDHVYRPPTQAVLVALDEYEGVPDLYRRVEVVVTLTDTGAPLSCWAYQYHRDVTGRRPIPNGTYAREFPP